jgi:hypothetical protein
MRYRVLLLALSCALAGPEPSVAQHGPTVKAPPPEASHEYGVSDDAGRIVYTGTTLRVFDTKAGTWTMRYVDQAGGETGRWSEIVGVKEGPEMHVEQRGQSPDGRTTILKIRYYNIQPNRFSWAADLSSDGGATWVQDYFRIDATRQVSTPASR